MAQDEQQRAQKPRASGPPPLRNKPAEIFSVIFIVAAVAFAIYWYMPAEMPLLSRRASEITGSVPPSRLTAESVKPLIARALAEEPMVLRVPLGDVVTVSTEGEPISIYAKLADAGLIRLRLCNFPGANGPGKERCVADLTEKGRQATASGTPSMVRESGLDFPTTNRSYEQFALAQASVKEITEVSQNGPDEATVTYGAAVEPNPLASEILTAGELPPHVAGRATLRREGSEWQVAQNALTP